MTHCPSFSGMEQFGSGSRGTVNLRSQLWTVFVLTTWGVSYERCLYWQLEEPAMNGVYITNLRSRLWTAFVLTTWRVSYERCSYWQLEESAKKGVCIDNLRSQLWTVFV
jgi:hypothetical protein